MQMQISLIFFWSCVRIQLFWSNVIQIMEKILKLKVPRIPRIVYLGLQLKLKTYTMEKLTFFILNKSGRNGLQSRSNPSQGQKQRIIWWNTPSMFMISISQSINSSSRDCIQPCSVCNRFRQGTSAFRSRAWLSRLIFNQKLLNFLSFFP